jgi:hypothetical protein
VDIAAERLWLALLIAHCVSVRRTAFGNVMVECLRKEARTMRAGKPREERKEQQWRRWMQIWRARGLSVAAYCARQGFCSAGFYG